MPVDAKPLFRPDVLRPHLHAFPWLVNIDVLRRTVGKWTEMFRCQRAVKFNEKKLFPDFLN